VPVVLSYPNSSVSCGFSSLADIIKKQFVNDKNLPYFSHYWTRFAAQKKQQAKNDTLQVTSNIIDRLSSPNKTEQKAHNLTDVYSLIDQQALSESQLKELSLNLESIYEKKHNKPLKDINSTVASILAEGDAEHIQKLHRAIGLSFERQFNKKISTPESEVAQLIQSEQFSKNEFNRLLADFTDIYKQRFNETFYSESNQMLTQIQQLLTDNKESTNR